MPDFLRVKTFEPQNILRVRPQAAQFGDFPGEITADVGRRLADHFAITGWVGNDIIGCCGIAELWTHRAMAWALLSADCSQHMVPITRLVHQALMLHPANRIEATVFEDFPAGRRWVEMLGFHCETPSPMRGYDARGRSTWLYAMVKSDLCSQYH